MPSHDVPSRAKLSDMLIGGAVAAALVLLGQFEDRQPLSQAAMHPAQVHLKPACPTPERQQACRNKPCSC